MKYFLPGSFPSFSLIVKCNKNDFSPFLIEIAATVLIILFHMKQQCFK